MDKKKLLPHFRDWCVSVGESETPAYIPLLVFIGFAQLCTISLWKFKQGFLSPGRNCKVQYWWLAIAIVYLVLKERVSLQFVTLWKMRERIYIWRKIKSILVQTEFFVHTSTIGNKKYIAPHHHLFSSLLTYLVFR